MKGRKSVKGCQCGGKKLLWMVATVKYKHSNTLNAQASNPGVHKHKDTKHPGLKRLKSPGVHLKFPCLFRLS